MNRHIKSFWWTTLTHFRYIRYLRSPCRGNMRNCTDAHLKQVVGVPLWLTRTCCSKVMPPRSVSETRDATRSAGAGSGVSRWERAPSSGDVRTRRRKPRFQGQPGQHCAPEWPLFCRSARAWFYMWKIVLIKSPSFFKKGHYNLFVNTQNSGFVSRDN